MNFYFFFEGQRTEPRVFRAWMKEVFPDLTEARKLSELKQNNFFVRSGRGYPAYLDRIEEVILDIERRGTVDHFFVCVDAEDDPVKILDAIQKRVAGRFPQTACQIIIANCCIETWFLGNEVMMPQQPARALLGEFKKHYDVSVHCPESMPLWRKYGRTRAQFHKAYLKELLRENGHSYSEINPGVVRSKEYLVALVSRHSNTGHIQSFGHLIAAWRTIGGSI